MLKEHQINRYKSMIAYKSADKKCLEKMYYKKNDFILAQCLPVAKITFNSLHARYFFVLLINSCLLLTFFKINFFKKFFQEHIRVSNGLDPDQDRHSIVLMFAEVISR